MNYLILTLTTILCACAANPPGMAGIPIAAFHQVDPGIYRGGQPDLEGIHYLQQLGVRTILDLNDDDEVFPNEIQWAKVYGIQLIHVPLSGFWEPSDADMELIEHTLENTKAAPIFVHCQHGHDRTGLAIGLYRVKHALWSKDRAHDEMLSLGFHPLLIGLEAYFWHE